MNQIQILSNNLTMNTKHRSNNSGPAVSPLFFLFSVLDYSIFIFLSVAPIGNLTSYRVPRGRCWARHACSVGSSVTLTAAAWRSLVHANEGRGQ